MTCHFGLTTKYLTFWAVCVSNTMKSLKVRNPRLLSDHMHKLLQGMPVAAQLLLSLLFIAESLGTKQRELWIQKMDLIAHLAFLPNVGQVAGRLIPCLPSLLSSQSSAGFALYKEHRPQPHQWLRSTDTPQISDTGVRTCQKSQLSAFWQNNHLYSNH